MKRHIAYLSMHITDDGKISRLSVLEPEDDDADTPTNMESELAGRELVTPINSKRDPGFDIASRLRYVTVCSCWPVR